MLLCQRLLSHSRLCFIVTVIGLASAMQTVASQMTSMLFEEGFASPVCLTWFSMHGLAFLGLPRLFDSAQTARSLASDDEHDGSRDSLPQPSNPVLLAHEAALADLLDLDHQRQQMTSRVEGWGRIVLLFVLYVIANVTYVVALREMTPALVSAIFCAAPAFVMLLSWPLLGRRIQCTDGVAVVLGASGVVLVAQPWAVGDAVAAGHPVGLMNLVCAVTSPVASALYKVCFARFYSRAPWKDVGVRLASISAVNVIVGTPLLVMFLMVGGESVPWASPTPIPWGYVMASMAASIAFNFLVNYGVTITFPLYVSVASLLSTGLNLSIEAIRHESASLNASRIAGLLLVVSSLVVLLVAAALRT